MPFQFFTIAALVIACAAGVSAQSDNDPYGKAGDYDVLIFARFWMGECAGRKITESVTPTALSR